MCQGSLTPTENVLHWFMLVDVTGFPNFKHGQSWWNNFTKITKDWLVMPVVHIHVLAHFTRDWGSVSDMLQLVIAKHFTLENHLATHETDGCLHGVVGCVVHVQCQLRTSNLSEEQWGHDILFVLEQDAAMCALSANVVKGMPTITGESSLITWHKIRIVELETHLWLCKLPVISTWSTVFNSESRCFPGQWAHHVLHIRRIAVHMIHGHDELQLIRLMILEDGCVIFAITEFQSK